MSFVTPTQLCTSRATHRTPRKRSPRSTCCGSRTKPPRARRSTQPSLDIPLSIAKYERPRGLRGLSPCLRTPFASAHVRSRSESAASLPNRGESLVRTETLYRPREAARWTLPSLSRRVPITAGGARDVRGWRRSHPPSPAGPTRAIPFANPLAILPPHDHRQAVPRRDRA